jgi:hypothetical protein
VLKHLHPSIASRTPDDNARFGPRIPSCYIVPPLLCQTGQRFGESSFRRKNEKSKTAIKIAKVAKRSWRAILEAGFSMGS